MNEPKKKKIKKNQELRKKIFPRLPWQELIYYYKFYMQPFVHVRNYKIRRIEQINELPKKNQKHFKKILRGIFNEN